MSPKRINTLLIEDDRESASLVTTAAEMAETAFEFHFVTNGLDALDYLYQQGAFMHASRPDLIVLDMNLPILSGWEVLKGIRRKHSLCNIPVVLLTTTNSHEHIKEEFHLTDQCCYTKPDRFNDYINLMKRLEELYHERKLDRLVFTAVAD